jgi:uncharacterized LabA/DUF88 family protein
MNIAFIDGENTKGRIREVFHKYNIGTPIWSTYRFKDLFDHVFQMNPVSVRKFYRAHPKSHPDLPEESNALMDSYRSLGGHLHREGFEVIRAGVLRADYRSPNDKKPKYREKGVDVSLAVGMVITACDNLADTIFLVASDSDYQPAVAEVRARNKRVVYVGFEINPNLGLKAKTDAHIIIPNTDVLRFGGVMSKK